MGVGVWWGAVRLHRSSVTDYNGLVVAVGVRERNAVEVHAGVAVVDWRVVEQHHEDDEHAEGQ